MGVFGAGTGNRDNVKSGPKNWAVRLVEQKGEFVKHFGSVLLLVSLLFVSRSWSREEHAILEAIERGDLDTVTQIVESGVSPNDYVDGRMAPIHAAAAYNKVEILEYLLDVGADLAEEEGYMELAKLLAAHRRSH